ncbi:hypothetical protein BDN70DRAFT_76448 [Pholiota conissans]|uniref:Uncharacterized protein n=1 Tax=Pholiota conissans TaxID=109636 RepID=A0A9P6CZR8_9AGAR|nr:hypothetical protein BDN70DRAFT_76448 [Pholiota conissans]
MLKHASMADVDVQQRTTLTIYAVYSVTVPFACCYAHSKSYFGPDHYSAEGFSLVSCCHCTHTLVNDSDESYQNWKLRTARFFSTGLMTQTKPKYLVMLVISTVVSIQTFVHGVD